VAAAVNVDDDNAYDDNNNSCQQQQHQQQLRLQLSMWTTSRRQPLSTPATTTTAAANPEHTKHKNTHTGVFLGPHPNTQNTSSLDVFSVFGYALLHSS